MLLKLLLSESLCLIPQEEQILIGSLSEESGDVLISAGRSLPVSVSEELVERLALTGGRGAAEAEQEEWQEGQQWQQWF